jgi:hypothetical protein
VNGGPAIALVGFAAALPPVPLLVGLARGTPSTPLPESRNR